MTRMIQRSTLRLKVQQMRATLRTVRIAISVAAVVWGCGPTQPRQPPSHIGREHELVQLLIDPDGRLSQLDMASALAKVADLGYLPTEETQDEFSVRPNRDFILVASFVESEGVEQPAILAVSKRMGNRDRALEVARDWLSRSCSTGRSLLDSAPAAGEYLASCKCEGPPGSVSARITAGVYKIEKDWFAHLKILQGGVAITPL